MNPRLFELLPNGAGFDIFQSAAASAGFECGLYEKLIPAGQAAEPGFLFRLFLHHGPNHQGIIGIDPEGEPVSPRRE